MKEYYFKYVVPGSVEQHFSRFKPASCLALKKDEKVYLTTFSKFNTYNEPYDEVMINSVEEIGPARKKLIYSFYKLTETSPMTRKDYRIAYRFLKIRATEFGVIEPFRATTNLPEGQQTRIYKFLKYNHNVKFM